MTASEGHKTLIVAAVWVALLSLGGSAAAAVRLELKLDKGKTYYERTMVDQRITNEVMGQQHTVHVVLGTIRELDVLDVDSQGNMRIRYTYNGLRFRMANPMGSVDYDSARHSSPPGGAEGFAALLGQSYTLRLSPTGKVLDVEGLDTLAETVRKKLPPGANLSSPGDPLSPYLNEQALREMTEGVLAVYPDKPVAQGDSWTETKLITHGLPMASESRWTLKELQGGVATVDSTATLKSDPDAPPMDAEGMKAKIEMSGSQTGTIRIEQATGLIRSNKGRMELKGRIGIGVSAEGPFDMMTIPMTVQNSYTVEMSDQMWETQPE